MLTRRQAGETLAAFFLSTLGIHSIAKAANNIVAQFDNDLQAISTNEKEIDASRGERELDYRIDGPTAAELAAQPSLAKRYKSSQPISAEAKKLIVIFEVSSRSRYETAYQRPIWPKGDSGVTIGIGYDLGYTDNSRFKEDWGSIFSPSTMDILEPALGVKGGDARNLLPFMQDALVTWDEALQQFNEMLKLVAGQVIHTFPGAEELNPHSFGALVSIVYNRGNGLKSNAGDKIDRRREMRSIRDALKSGKVETIPSEILSMRRIWSDKPEAKGLLKRRELEARLFEIGLKG